MRKTIFAIMVLLTGSAQAALIDNGSYTTDTVSGLDWRDVTDTTNQSVNYVLSQMVAGGVYEGWRYATNAELATFWTHAGGSGSYNGWSVENNGLYARLSPLWGNTRGTLTNGGAYVATADLAPFCGPPGIPYRCLAILHDWSDYAPLESATMDFADMRWHMHVDAVRPEQGHALVRNAVPEPSAITLLALGLSVCTLGMWLRRCPQ